MLFSLIMLRQAFPELYSRSTRLIDEMLNGYNYLYTNYKSPQGWGPQGFYVNLTDPEKAEMVWYSWFGTYGEAIASASIYSYVMGTSQPLDLQWSPDCEYEGITMKNYHYADGSWFNDWKPWEHWIMIFFVPEDDWRWENDKNFSLAYIKYHQLEVVNGGPLGLSDGDTEWGWMVEAAPFDDKNTNLAFAYTGVPWNNTVFPLGAAMANIFWPNDPLVLDSLKFWVENKDVNDHLYGAYKTDNGNISDDTWNYGFMPSMTLVALNYEIVRQYTFQDPIVEEMSLYLKLCNPDGTGTDGICYKECGADQKCDEKNPNTGCCSGCYYVDINGDGIVDYRDINFVARIFGCERDRACYNPLGYNPLADFNKDDIIDMRDISQVSRIFGKECTG